MIDVLTTNSQVESLAEEWAELYAQTPGATPFQSPFWLIPWWRHFGTGLPRIAVSRWAGRLTGVLPLYILPTESKALPIGAGVTDYIDVLGRPNGLLEAAVSSIGDGVCSCDLIDVHWESPLRQASPSGLDLNWFPNAPCPVLTLPGVTKLARRKFNMSRNRAERAGGWTVKEADAATIDFHMHELIRLHQARWTSRGEPGVMGDLRVQRFLLEAGPGLLRSGSLRLQSLFIAGSAVATILALLAPGRIFFYLSGFDERHAFVSPGTILLGEMLEQAASEARGEAHFLRGREPYKYSWGAEDRHNWACQIIMR